MKYNGITRELPQCSRGKGRRDAQMHTHQSSAVLKYFSLSSEPVCSAWIERSNASTLASKMRPNLPSVIFLISSSCSSMLDRLLMVAVAPAVRASYSAAYQRLDYTLFFLELQSEGKIGEERVLLVPWRLSRMPGPCIRRDGRAGRRTGRRCHSPP